ncbi:MAG: T9SS type A sorting domain-containing protein [Bacteroidota bacterium]|nr:T9SS type A sorting domain-containing protein [Bacteroidota bacterium]
MAQFPFGVQLVYFKDFTSVPQDGFVSITADGTGLQKLWRTLDGGLSWRQITLPLNFNGGATAPISFSFKNMNEGWFGDFEGHDVFHTNDGGDSWIQSIKDTISVSSVFYVPLTNSLIVTGAGSLAGLAGSLATVGTAFTDSIHGIISGGNSQPVLSKSLYTSDAGLTWQQSTFDAEQYQPIGLQGTMTFFALTEQDCPPNVDQVGSLSRSDDGGITWRKIYQYHDHTNFSVTGTLQNNAMGIFFQTTLDNSEGIMMSSDSGTTLYSICGPINDVDTRFYVRDSFIYAGDKHGGLWLNTTGIGSNSTPQLSLTRISAPALFKCQNFDTVITFTFFDSCNNNQAKLVGASISGSPSFSFSSPSLIPRTIHPNDSLTVSYRPQSTGADTAQLHLRFHLGFKDFDTVIPLFGGGMATKESVRFIPVILTSSAAAGSYIDLLIKPDKSLSGRDLQSITFDLSYYGDLFEIVSPSSPNPSVLVTTGTKTQNGKIETLPVTITGKDISLDSTEPIAVIKLWVMLTDTTFTTITMSDLKLNNDDSDYKNCILSADAGNANFTLHFDCGDSTIYKYLRTGSVLGITSLRPNPAQDEVQIDVQSATKQDASIEIRNALGVQVYSDAKSLSVGSNGLHLETKGLASGLYIVRITSACGATSQEFVKVK